MVTQDQFDELQRQLVNSEAELQAAQAEAKAAQARFEQERSEKEAAHAREENQRRWKELLQQDDSPTSLHDYLRNCHTHLYKNLRISPKSLSTTGSRKSLFRTGSTSVAGKFYPRLLLPWTDFETDIVPRHFGAIDKIYGDVQAFESKSSVVSTGSFIAHNDSEEDITYFQRYAVDHPVMDIIDLAALRNEFQTRYDTKRVYFTQRLSEVSQSNVAGSDNKAADPPQHDEPKPPGIGLRTRKNGEKCLAFVYDYQAPHKVDNKYIQDAVANKHLFDEVVQRIRCDQKPTDDAVRLQEDAEASIATSLVHVYDYMVKCGVAFGYVAAGSTLLLLYVDNNDPQTLFCHPCMPLDLADPIDGSMDVTRTTVAQMLCFCLQSCQSDAHPSGSRSLDAAFVRTVASTNTWPVPDSELMSTERASARRSSRRDADKSDEDGEGGPSNCECGDDSPGDSSDDAPSRQYCTQACLLGLQRGHDLDENCPNVTLHRDGRADVSRHPLDAGQFADLMGQQLRRDPYHKCTLVNFWTKGGAMGWMFKLELLPYGYTVVGKGTVADHGARLEHEGRIYERLSSLQGHVVPVHLGLVDMGRGYIIPGFRFVVHMMLMSWAGETPDDDEDESPDDGPYKTRADEIFESIDAMWDAGVHHGDNCSTKYEWNAERKRIMFFDFDHARLLSMSEAKDGVRPRQQMLNQIAAERARMQFMLSKPESKAVDGGPAQVKDERRG